MKNPKVSEGLKNLLNEAIARELQVSVQYMWQNVLARGIRGLMIKDEFRKIAITEMKHAEAIAERLVYLGGRPTIEPAPIIIGNTLVEMLQQDKKDEEGAIELYKHIIGMARGEKDEITEKLFIEILADEEKHHDIFTSLLEDI